MKRSSKHVLGFLWILASLLAALQMAVAADDKNAAATTVAVIRINGAINP